MILFVIAVISLWIVSLHFPDGILGGLIVVVGLGVALRELLDIPAPNVSQLQEANAWVLLLAVVVYLAGVLVLPECSRDRYSSRYCRTTFTYGPWMVSLGVALFVAGALMDAPLFALAMAVGVGWVHYGMYGTSLTDKERRQIALRGGMTEDTLLTLNV